METDKFSFSNKVSALITVLFGFGFIALAVVAFFSSAKIEILVFFFLIGAISFFMAKYESIEVDSSAGTIIYSCRSLMANRTETLPFSDISSVKFAKIYVPGRKGGRWEARTYIRQKNGAVLEVQYAISKPEEAKKIAEVVGAEFIYDKPPSLIEELGKVKDAILTGLEQSKKDGEKTL